MSQESQSQALALVRALKESGNVCQHEAATGAAQIVIDITYAQVRNHGGERIVGDLGLSVTVSTIIVLYQLIQVLIRIILGHTCMLPRV